MYKIRKVIIEYTKKHVESLLSRNPYTSIQTYIYTYIYIKYKIYIKFLKTVYVSYILLKGIYFDNSSSQ